MIVSQRKATLSEKAYDEIKNAICDGTITAGTLLSENALAQQLGMSRTPVREAMRALESEGWLDIRSGIGAYVRPLSSKDIEDLYEVRCLLEVQAAKTSIFHITDEEISDFEIRFQSLLDTVQSSSDPDLALFSSLDWELHELIVDRCQNTYIKNIMHSNMANMKRYLSLSAEALNDLHESTLQHIHLLSLIRKRDTGTFCAALDEHLKWASSFLTIT